MHAEKSTDSTASGPVAGEPTAGEPTDHQNLNANAGLGRNVAGAIEVSVPMRWADMDAYGHINNVQVLRLLEEARIAAFGQPVGTGMPGIAVEMPIFSDLPDGIQSLVVEHRVKYLKPLNYRNVPARIRLWVSAIKGASFSLCYSIFDPVDGDKCVVAETTLVFFDEPQQKLMRIPASKKQQLQQLKGEAHFA